MPSTPSVTRLDQAGRSRGPQSCPQVLLDCGTRSGKIGTQIFVDAKATQARIQFGTPDAGRGTVWDQIGNRAVVAHHDDGCAVTHLIQGAGEVLSKLTHRDCATHTTMVVKCRLSSICAGQRQMCRSAPVSESAEMSPEGWNLPGTVR